MKRMYVACLALSLLSSAQAVDRVDLDKRLINLRTKFESLQARADKRIPEDTLRRAVGIILLDRVKAGLGFAYQGGSGVAMLKDTQTGEWGAPVFLSANQASIGPQAGGKESFTVVLLMSTNSTGALTEPTFEFGGEASATAGNASAKAEGTILSPDRQVLVFGESEGFYGGASVKTGKCSPDTDANRVYYAEPLTAREILFDKKVRATEPAVNLARTLTEYSKAREQ